jgi:hypothetical protein
VPKIRSDRALASSCTLARITCEAGPARAAHAHENRKLARHARAHLSAPRRRGGAELSGESGNVKVRCHGEGDFWLLAASAPAKYCLLHCTALLIIAGWRRRAGCQAPLLARPVQRHYSAQHSARSSETPLRHALHLLSALSGCRHASQ